VPLLLLVELELLSLPGEAVDGDGGVGTGGDPGVVGGGRPRLTRAKRRSEGVDPKRTSKSVELHSSSESGGAPARPEAAAVAAFFSSCATWLKLNPHRGVAFTFKSSIPTPICPLASAGSFEPSSGLRAKPVTFHINNGWNSMKSAKKESESENLKKAAK